MWKRNNSSLSARSDKGLADKNENGGTNVINFKLYKGHIRK